LKKRTYIEAPLFLLLLGVGIAIAARFWTQKTETQPEPEPTPVPRMAHLLRSVPVATPTATSDPSGSPTGSITQTSFPPETVPESETEILVIQVREQDGRVPADQVFLQSPIYGTDLEVINGRLALEVVTGTLSFNVVAKNGNEVRPSETLSATVSSGSPSLLEFTLPPPVPRFISAGLELQRQPDGYWSVSGIVAGSAAEQVGLQVDDAVLTIHGHTPSALTDAQAAASLLGSPGDRIPLQVVIRNAQGTLEEHQVEMVIPAP